MLYRVMTVFGVAALLCLPPAQAQSGSQRAVVAAMSGRVSFERAGELWTVSAGQAVEIGQVIVTGNDGQAQLALPDGSTLEIFPNSRVVYQANRFNLREVLDVLLGKVRLHIQHLVPGERPLRVTSPTAVISVRGTVFEVEVDSLQDTVVSVDSGAVGVRHRLIPGGEVLVQTGESLRIAASLPLAAAAKPSVPLRSIGRVVQVVADTLAQVRAVTGSSSGGGATATSPGSTVPASDTGSNETKPPAGSDDDAPAPGSDSSPSPGAPPGDVLP